MISTKQTGYPSIDKPWMKYYDEIYISKEIPRQNIYDFMRQCNDDALNNVAINYFGKKVLFEEFFDSIHCVAKGLWEVGVRNGDVVTIVSVTVPELEILLYALNMIGACVNMMDVRYEFDNIEQSIKETDSTLLIIMDEFIDKIEGRCFSCVDKILFLSAYNYLPSIKKMIANVQHYKNRQKVMAYINDKKDSLSVFLWKDIIERSKGSSFEYESSNEDLSEKLVAMVHTGGTTGVSKTVKLSNKNFNAMVIQFMAFNTYIKGDTFLNDIVPFVAYGLLGAMHMPMCLGLTNIIAPIFTPEEFTDFMVRYKPNNLLAVPTYWDNFINNPKAKKLDLSFLKHPGSGGDATSKEAEEKTNLFFEKHGSRAVIELGYGMTEVSSAATACVGEINKIGSVGIPLVKNNVKVIDPETGNELTYNNTGEICITSPTIMLGYLNNQEQEDLLIQKEEGTKWIHSGDLGYIDEDGFLFIVGRIKRMLIRGGFKIYPSEIERVVCTHEQVKEACCVGIPSKQYGNEAIVYIVLLSEIDKSSIIQEIKAICEAGLPEYAMPYGIECIDEMPITTVGKIDYRKLEKQASNCYPM